MGYKTPEYVTWDNSSPLTTLMEYLTEGILLKITADGRSLAQAPYQWANIDYRLLDPDKVVPTATYVIRHNLDEIEVIGNLLAGFGLNMYDLQGMVRFGQNDFIAPPVLEVWEDPPYNGRPVIVDGAHRLWSAKQSGKSEVGCIVVSGRIFHMLPVLPLEGWGEVREVDEIPDFKRRYASVPSPYKSQDLYRVGFPGSTGFRPVAVLGEK